MRQRCQKNVLSTRFVVSVTTLIVLVVRHDFEVVMFVVGGVLNAIWSKMLKKLWNASRPVKASAHGMVDPGMPSSHSQTLFYYNCCLFFEVQRSVHLSPLVRMGGFGLFTFFASSASAFRVVRGFHTWAQVIVGAVCGILFACWWWLLYPYLALVYEAYGPMPYWAQIVCGCLAVATAAVVIERSLQKRIIVAGGFIKDKLSPKLRPQKGTWKGP